VTPGKPTRAGGRKRGKSDTPAADPVEPEKASKPAARRSPTKAKASSATSPKKSVSSPEAPKPKRSRKKKPAAVDATVEAIEPEVVESESWEPSSDDAGLAVAEGAHAADRDGAPAAPLDAVPLPVPVDEHSTALVKRDALSAYLADIRQYPVLTREEEHELAVRYYEHGDVDAAYKLITSNLKLVVMVAREYQRAFHNLLDLVQEGNVGLLEAVKQFDPYRGVRLPSYAVWWIRAYVIRYVMNNFRLVKVGTTQAQRRLFFNLQKEKARLEREGFKPTADLIAKNLGVKEKEVIEMDMRMGASEVSADAPLGPDSDASVIDLLPQDGATAEDEVADREWYDLMRQKLAEFQDTLEGRDYEIFTERLLAEEPLTLKDLGERYGVSRERVRQVEEALRKRLREFLVAQVREVSPEERAE